MSLKVSKLPDDNDACTISHNQGVGIKNVAGSLLVFKNGALITWPKKKRRKERKTLRERERERKRERERVGGGGAYNCNYDVCPIVYQQKCMYV